MYQRSVRRLNCVVVGFLQEQCPFLSFVSGAVKGFGPKRYCVNGELVGGA